MPAQRTSTRDGKKNPFGSTTNAGIQKRRSPIPRVDKDGDLDMDAGSGRGRGRGGGRGSGHNRDSGKGRPQRNGIDPLSIKRTLGRDLESTAAAAGKSKLAAARLFKDAKEGLSKRGKLEEIVVRGWKESKAASNPGGCKTQLHEFLERKASTPAMPVKIPKSRIQGDNLIISVRPEDKPAILRLNSYTFVGVPLTIEEWSSKKDGGLAGSDSGTSMTATEIREKMTAMLSRRYNTEAKLLDLSLLGTDPEFQNTGIFDTDSTQSKFFPAIMKVCDSLFESAQQKREAVESVSLASNNLSTVSAVTELAQTLPEIKNLDLSGNSIKDLNGLVPWKRKFRSLSHLVLSGNPLETGVPNYQQEVMGWFPTLKTLDTTQVRSDEDVALALKSKFPLPIRVPDFRDEVSIGENFVKQFFPGYDSDRTTLANSFYDAASAFSLSVNVSAPRAQEHQPAGWDMYIKKSRNLAKVHNLPTRMSRSYKGPESILEVWLNLPATRHPDLLAESTKWCIECHSLPGLPDLATQSPYGVGGLIVMVHGEFGEVNVATGEITSYRSFDRTFILGPGGGIGGIRVVNDILALRAHGGHEAWKPTEEESTTVPQVPNRIPAGPTLPEGFGVASNGKSPEQVQKELVALELSKLTRMTLEYSAMCLEQTTWDLESAVKAFEEVKATLPPEAFY